MNIDDILPNSPRIGGVLTYDGLAATPLFPFRVKLLLLHAEDALHLSNGGPVLSRQDWERWITKTEYLSCCLVRNTSN